MQKSLFPELEAVTPVDHLVSSEAYLTDIEKSAQQMRAEAFNAIRSGIARGFAKLFASKPVSAETENLSFIDQLVADEAYLTNIEKSVQQQRAEAFSGTIAAIFTGIAKIVGGISKMIKVNRSIQELHAMDDRMLADIGLTRGDIEAAMRGEIVRSAPLSTENVAFFKKPAAKTTVLVETNKKRVAA